MAGKEFPCQAEQKAAGLWHGVNRDRKAGLKSGRVPRRWVPGQQWGWERGKLLQHSWGRAGAPNQSNSSLDTEMSKFEN